MRIYFKVLGGHVHCRVFTVGSMCGTLVFTVNEWTYVQTHFNAASVAFIDETEREE